MSLTDLPAELLLQIYDYVGVHSLLEAGQLCRQFNQVLLPFYLHEQGIDTENMSTRLVLNTKLSGQDALAAFNMGACHAPMDLMHLTCVVDHSREPYNMADDADTDSSSSTSSWVDFGTTASSRIPKYEPISSIIQQCRRVQRFIESLSSLSAFYFVLPPHNLSATDDLHPVAEAIFRVVDAATRKSCSSIQLWHSYCFLRSMRDYPTSATPSIHAQDLELDEAEEGFQKQRNNLTSLEITSDFLFLPPHASKTYSLINNSFLTSLSLTFPPSISPADLRYTIFPTLAKCAPFIRELKVSFDSDRHLSTFVAFLTSFAYLESLDIALAFGTHDLTTQALVDIPESHPLPLQTITGSPDQIAYILSHPIAFPNLESINIIVDISIRGRYDYYEMATSFWDIQDFITNQGTSPVVSVCLSNYGEDPPLEGDDDGWVGAFDCVSRLTLKIVPLTLEGDGKGEHQGTGYVSKWLRVFCNLEELYVIVHRPSTPTTDLESAEQDTAQLQASGRLVDPALLETHTTLKVLQETVFPPGREHIHWSNKQCNLARVMDELLAPPLWKSTLKAKTTALYCGF